MKCLKRRALLLLCPLLACADDVAELQLGTTSSGEDTMGPVSIDPPTATSGDTDLSATSVDGTGPAGETSASLGETGSSSGDSGSSSSGDSGSSSSGGPGCGDDHLDAGEQCDGTDLAGYDCSTLGPDFTGGTLACAPDCTFDTSACMICGNGVIDGAEVCDGDDLGGLGCANVGGGLTGGVLGCDAACGHDTTACTSVPWPLQGEVIITEMMPHGMEWFEIYNLSLGSFQLGSCEIENGYGHEFSIDVDLEIGPGEYRVFAQEWLLDPGFIADYEWLAAEFDITHWDDTVRLRCNGIVVDSVSVGDKEGDSYPGGTSSTASLDPGSYDFLANNDYANWCDAITLYGYYNHTGTPRYSNPDCGAGPVDYPIDSCRLQLPGVIVEDQGTDVTVYGRLAIAGLTDLSVVDDPAQQVLGDVGYGPAGSDPAVDATWTWVNAVPNPSYDPASPDYEADLDEYYATFPIPGPGTYDYAYRFSGSGGTTFTYCDGLAAGSSDGYQSANAGQLTSNAVIPPVLYISEYVEGSNGNWAIEIYNPTAEAADIGACDLHRYYSGNPVAGPAVDLADNIAAGDVLVVCSYYIDDTSFCDLIDPLLSFSGDTAIELECSGVTLDVIGQIGFDPGTEWLVGGVGTRDETLRRSCSVTAGDANGADAFDPSLEWATFPQDTFADLGQYVCP